MVSELIRGHFPFKELIFDKKFKQIPAKSSGNLTRNRFKGALAMILHSIQETK